MYIHTYFLSLSIYIYRERGRERYIALRGWQTTTRRSRTAMRQGRMGWENHGLQVNRRALCAVAGSTTGNRP